MGLGRRLVRLIWRDSLDPALRPMVAQDSPQLPARRAGAAGFGDAAMWTAFAAVSVLAAATGAAVRGIRVEPLPPVLAESA